MGQGTARPGQSAPWILIDASSQPDAVKAATEYLAGLDLAADPDVAQAADDSGNPALAAALGKLGAKKK